MQKNFLSENEPKIPCVGTKPDHALLRIGKQFAEPISHQLNSGSESDHMLVFPSCFVEFSPRVSLSSCRFEKFLCVLQSCVTSTAVVFIGRIEFIAQRGKSSISKPGNRPWRKIRAPTHFCAPARQVKSTRRTERTTHA